MRVKLLITLATAAVGFMAITPAAAARRPPTEQERAELTAAAQSWLESNYPGYWGTVELHEARISTVDETWAFAGDETKAAPAAGAGIFKLEEGEWRMLSTSSGCLEHRNVPGISVAVARDLHACVTGVWPPAAVVRPKPPLPAVYCAGGLRRRSGAYEIRPHKCVLHDRYEPFIGAAESRLRASTGFIGAETSQLVSVSGESPRLGGFR